MSKDVASNILDLLIEKHAPETKTTTYTLEGQVFEFEILSDMVRHNEIFKAGADWVKTMLDLHEKKKLTAQWAEIFEPDTKLLAEVFLLCTLAQDPALKDKFKMFRMARKVSTIFFNMYNSVTSAAIKSPEKLEAEAVEEAKKD